MMRTAFAVLALLSLLAPGPVRAAEAAPVRHDNKAMQSFVDGLVRRMTLRDSNSGTRARAHQ